MIAKNTRRAYQIVGLLICVAFISMLASTEVRAMVRSLLTFNGVEVSLDNDTNELTVDGNEAAVISQNGQEVIIQGADVTGTETGWVLQVALKPGTDQVSQQTGTLDAEGNFVPNENQSMALKMIPFSELDSLAPDFEVPATLPAGYTLAPWAVSTQPDESIMVRWNHESGETIMYLWGESALNVQENFGTIGQGEAHTVVTIETPANPQPENSNSSESTTATTATAAGGLDGPLTFSIFQGEIENIPFIIIATDSTLTEDDLQDMIP